MRPHLARAGTPAIGQLVGAQRGQCTPEAVARHIYSPGMGILLQHLAGNAQHARAHAVIRAQEALRHAGEGQLFQEQLCMFSSPILLRLMYSWRGAVQQHWSAECLYAWCAADTMHCKGVPFCVYATWHGRWLGAVNTAQLQRMSSAATE